VTKILLQGGDDSIPYESGVFPQATNEERKQNLKKIYGRNKSENVLRKKVTRLQWEKNSSCLTGKKGKERKPDVAGKKSGVGGTTP